MPARTPIDYVLGASTKDPAEEQALRQLRAQLDQEFRECAADFWYFCQFVKTEDEDAGELRDFPVHYEHLRKLDYEIEHTQKAIILKSRRLMISWLGMLRMLHSAMFAGSGHPGTYDSFRGGVMSIGETEATYLMERIIKVYKRLPDWLRDRSRMTTENKLFVQFEAGGTIQAFPMKREGPQTFGFTRVFFDEMALQEAARTTWTGLIPTLGAKGKLLAVSTPNGKTNLFYDIWSNKNEMYHGMLRVKLHWTGRAEFDLKGKKTTYTPSEQPHDEEWYRQVTVGMDKQMIARMFELSFAAYLGDPVWNRFERHTHCVPETQIMTMRPVLLGWDFGFHFPATVMFQYNTLDQFVGHAEYQDFDVEFGDYAEAVFEYCNGLYNVREVPTIHFVDPAGRQRYHSQAKSGAINDIQEIQRVFRKAGGEPQIRFGAVEIGTRSNEGPRLKETRKVFNLRADGRPGIVLSEQGMSNFIEGCLGAYHYDEKGGETPVKDEASHLQDAFQYIVTGRGAMFADMKPEPQQLPPRRRKSRWRMGL